MPIATRRLPAQPNLEQLRKQAKELLEQCRAGDPTAAAEARQFEWRIPPADLALHDAQRVLARAYGFESWTKLKAFVDGANVKGIAKAVQRGDAAAVRELLHSRPELVDMNMSGGDERRALHFAVLRRDAPMVKLLMEAGADARKGVYPHREATSPLAIARDRGYAEIVAVIEEEERLRREEMSCPNATVSPVQEQIAAAIRRGGVGEAIRLIETDTTLIHACDRHGGTPLHIAAQEANFEMLEWLLERRADPGREDVFGLTPLDRAALAADPRSDCVKRFAGIAKRLLERGAAMTIRAAVALGDVDRVRESIAVNPGVVREIGPRDGLLSLAVTHAQIEMARLLLDAGADVDERVMLDELEEPTPSWGKPLWLAALAGDYAMCELLLDRGADLNANVYASGWPLRNAWHHPDGRVRNLLLARGAVLQPYMLAELHDVEAAKRLLDSDPEEKVVAELLDAGADSGCPEIVRMALQRLDWPRSDSKWRWYLIQPVRGIGGAQPDHEGHFECMRLLLGHGIDPNVATLGQTALHFTAACHGEVSDPERARFTAMLLDHGARLDLRDEMLASTPLAWACRWGRTEMVELLIARGAPVDEPGAEPWAAPLAWAERMKHGGIAALLRSRGGSPTAG